MTKRALRRHHYFRRVRAEYLKWSRGWEPDEEWLINTSRFRANLRTHCSCEGCGNPRKHFKAQTRQEAKLEQDHKEQFKDLGLKFHSRFKTDW